MYSYKNIKYLNEIRKWNTAQLIEALETNGLGDCCEAIEIRQIDGESFLNLTEGQLTFWKNTLSNVQIKRLWSYIQLARENPQNFITSFSQNQPTPTITQNTRQIPKEKPQNFVPNIPQNKPTPTRTLNTRKVEKIKSPIAESLENLLGQQNNSTPVEIPEGNYPKLKPPLTPNELQVPVSPRSGALPPKPSNLVKRFPPPPPVDVNSLPSIPPFPPSFNNSSPNQQYEDEEEEEEEDFYEDEPVLELQNKLPPPLPPVNSSTLYKIQTPLPEPMRKEKPLPINIKNYNIPQHQEHEEEDVYEDEPMFESQNNPSPLPPQSSSPIYKVPLSNPIPIRRETPQPFNFSRKLPTPPRDEIPFQLPPNVVPVTRKSRSPQPPDMGDLPRPPISFVPPPHIPDFHDDDDDVEYDFVDGEQPEYKLQSWFKDIDRKEAVKLLRGLPNGTFIARPSTQSDYECTFSVVYERKIYNLPVMKVEDKVVLGKNAFDTVMEIVDKFSTTPLVLNGPNNEDVYLCLRK